MTIPVGATHKLRGEFYREDFDSWHRLVEGKWVAVPQASWDWVTRHAAPITAAMRQAVAAAEAKKSENPLVVALRDCVSVMERDLNGLAVIQPELRQAREALAVADAPAEPWNGEGLPPVDLAVEWYSDSNTGWQEITVLAYHGDDAWIQPKGKESMIVGNIANFRPIRTPEQIAEEARQKEIDGIRRDLQDRQLLICDNLADLLHDAGYRKQVAP